jgi:hypothetical protein
MTPFRETAVQQHGQDLLDHMLREKPRFHRAETEIRRNFSASDSYLKRGAAEQIAGGIPLGYYGLPDECMHFLYENIQPGDKTLETGAGLSTLVFAMRGAKHIAITPNEEEIAAIRNYAGTLGIDMAAVTFVARPSHEYLPSCDACELDAVLLDGKHAFPFPIVDWFFTADRLKVGGLMFIDDRQIRVVVDLMNFMDVDPRWEFVGCPGWRTCVYRKLSGPVHDVAWHMQPYCVTPTRPLWRRVAGRLTRLLSTR